MLVVRKPKDQWLTTANERFTQGESRASARQCQQGDQRAENDCEHEARMPSEYQSADEARGLVSRLMLGAPAQQREQHDAREQNVDDYMRTTMDVTTRSQYVHRQSDHQQAG